MDLFDVGIVVLEVGGKAVRILLFHMVGPALAELNMTLKRNVQIHSHHRLLQYRQDMYKASLPYFGGAVLIFSNKLFKGFSLAKDFSAVN